MTCERKVSAVTWAVVVVVTMAVAVSCQTPPTPVVIRQFYDPQFQGNFGISGFGIVEQSEFWYDDVYQAWKAAQQENSYGFPRNITILQAPTQSYFSINGVCREIPGSGDYQGLFSWLPYATYGGPATINNRSAEMWYFTTHNGPIVYYGDSSNTSIPVQFLFPSVPFTSTQLINFTFTFSEALVPGAIANPEDVFLVDSSCLGDGILCPVPEGESDTVSFEAFVFHPPNDFSLVNDNIADLYGDTFFVCGSVVADQFTYFELISQWKLIFNASFGQYALCNFGNCFGGNPNAVGRESAAGVGELSGQCSEYPNNITGNWISLQNVSMCAPGEPIGTNGCAWQVVGRIKTINSTCLFNHSFAEACVADFSTNRFPLENANSLFLQAFESDEESQNGCPALPGPEELFGISDIEAAISSPKGRVFAKRTPTNSNAHEFERFAMSYRAILV